MQTSSAVLQLLAVVLFGVLASSRTAAFVPVMCKPPTSSNRQNNGALQATKIGFVGCGTIAAAVARGLATQTEVPIASIAVSQRSKSKSDALRNDFPDLVTVHEVNQEILDKSDLVFLCVLPSLASEVLKSLAFDPSRHELISLVSTSKMDSLAEDSKLPPSNVSRLICLPSIARHSGVSLYCAPAGPNPLVLDALDATGGVVYCDSEDQFYACMMTTCAMGPCYGTMKRSRDWLVKRGGLSQRDASYLVIQQYRGMIQDAVDRMDDDEDGEILDELIEEQTPNGLNEQALANFAELGGLEAYDDVMDAVLSRIRGESDGSIA